jgi:hypothetical protein
MLPLDLGVLAGYACDKKLSVCEPRMATGIW